MRPIPTLQASQPCALCWPGGCLQTTTLAGSASRFYLFYRTQLVTYDTNTYFAEMQLLYMNRLPFAFLGASELFIFLSNVYHRQLILILH